MKDILVVDNNPMVLQFLEEILTEEGYNIQTACDGLEAVELIDQYSPDAFIIDLVMPKIEGDKLARIIKNRSRFRNAPIIILSAIAIESRDYQATDIADCYVAKMPFTSLKKYMIQILSDLEQGEWEKYKNTIVGVDEIFAREITSELLRSKKHLDILLKNVSAGYIELTEENKIVYANQAALRITGEAEEQLLGTDFLELFDPDTRETVSELIEKPTLDSSPEEEGPEIRINERIITLTLHPIESDSLKSTLVIMEDRTAHKNAEKALLKSLDEKDILLNEINHRVKNNLAIISSLINLKEATTGGEIDLSDIQHQIDAIRIVHEKLYQTEEITHINMHDYIQDLLDTIFSSFTKQKVTIEDHVDDISLRTKSAIQLGLIINEVATNTIKYGSSRNEELRFTIEFREDSTNGEYILSISNNGKPIPEEINVDNASTLGLQLVSILVEQLEGTLELQRSPHPRFTIRFPRET
jgi:PAS domain S-box-containing protein